MPCESETNTYIFHRYNEQPSISTLLLFIDVERISSQYLECAYSGCHMHEKAFDATKRPPNKCSEFFFLKSLDDPKNQTLVKGWSRF